MLHASEFGERPWEKKKWEYEFRRFKKGNKEMDEHILQGRMELCDYA